jgi:hypothetical protein
MEFPTCEDGPTPRQNVTAPVPLACNTCTSMHLSPPASALLARAGPRRASEVSVEKSCIMRSRPKNVLACGALFKDIRYVASKPLKIGGYVAVLAFSF